jgi:hypothetical protein
MSKSAGGKIYLLANYIINIFNISGVLKNAYLCAQILILKLKMLIT